MTSEKDADPIDAYHASHPDRIRIVFDDHRLVANSRSAPATTTLANGIVDALAGILDVDASP